MTKQTSPPSTAACKANQTYVYGKRNLVILSKIHDRGGGKNRSSLLFFVFVFSPGTATQEYLGGEGIQPLATVGSATLREVRAVLAPLVHKRNGLEDLREEA